MKTFSREIYDKANRVKMTDYLKIYEKFKDVREVKVYIDDVILLRHYYATQQYSQMQDHIRKLMNKHLVEALAWNAVNSSQPTTIEQSYINAEHFLQMQGAKIIAEKVKDYAQRLNDGEKTIIESLIKPME